MRLKPAPAKIALSTVSVYPESPAAAFEIASRLGYDGVEVMVMTDSVTKIPKSCVSSVRHTVCRFLPFTLPAS